MKTIFANLLRRWASRLDPVDWTEIERQTQQAFDVFDKTFQSQLEAVSEASDGK